MLRLLLHPPPVKRTPLESGLVVGGSAEEAEELLKWFHGENKSADSGGAAGTRRTSKATKDGSKQPEREEYQLSYQRREV